MQYLDHKSSATYIIPFEREVEHSAAFIHWLPRDRPNSIQGKLLIGEGSEFPAANGPAINCDAVDSLTAYIVSSDASDLQSMSDLQKREGTISVADLSYVDPGFVTFKEGVNGVMEVRGQNGLDLRRYGTDFEEGRLVKCDDHTEADKEGDDEELPESGRHSPGAVSSDADDDEYLTRHEDSPPTSGAESDDDGP